MTRSFRQVSIDGSVGMYYDILVYDSNESDLVFAKIIGADKLIKNVTIALKRRVNAHLSGWGNLKCKDGYTIEKEKPNDSDFAVISVMKNDIISKTETGDLNGANESYIFYVIHRNETEMFDVLHDKIYKNTSIPVLREWMPYIYARLNATSRRVRRLAVTHSYAYNSRPLECTKFIFTNNELLNIITNGLQNNNIQISNINNNTTNIMLNLEGLDDYLNIYGDTLANRIQEAFTPLFNPRENPNYSNSVNKFDDSCYYSGKYIYEAQKAAIQSVIESLKLRKTTLVIGECGVGKTLMASGMIYSDYGKKAGSTTIILCPGHLPSTWIKEISNVVPNSKICLITSITDLKALDSEIRDKNKNTHLFLVITKEEAKNDYAQGPTAILKYNKTAGRVVYCCPECGQPLMKTIKDSNGDIVNSYFDENDLSSKKEYNKYCYNTIYRKNNKVCMCPLWGNLTKPIDTVNKNGKTFGKQNRWYKVPNFGWINLDDLQNIYNKYYVLLQNGELKQKDQKFLSTIRELIEEENRSGIKNNLFNRRYALAKYIKNKYKNCIDYAILDELQCYKGKDTDQGIAMAYIAQASKKVLGLTGTLINGYANSLFYILYRTMPGMMKRAGYEYNDSNKFQKLYGVTEKTSRGRFVRNNFVVDSSGASKPKPGVSPLIFTDFLLETAVFISINDMAEGLPEYTEIPMGIDMDTELRREYNNIQSSLTQACRATGTSPIKAMGALLHTLRAYPDMPYDCKPIIHPDTGDTIYTPTDLEKGLRNKERALIDLVKRKIEGGEKCLIYYDLTNITDVDEKLENALKDEGIKAINLYRTSTKQILDREEWIRKQVEEENIDVLLCNPKLVETGLNLLEFTTIIFYQMGYNVFTLRQASRRSYRVNQTHDVEVYFLYYRDTIQETAMALMGSKLKASKAAEGDMCEEGIAAMADNEDLNAKIAASVVNGIKNVVDTEIFTNKRNMKSSIRMDRIQKVRVPKFELLVDMGINNELKFHKTNKIDNNTQVFMKQLFDNEIDLNNVNLRLNKYR